jgi:hypothetical protein
MHRSLTVPKRNNADFASRSRDSDGLSRQTQNPGFLSIFDFAAAVAYEFNHDSTPDLTAWPPMLMTAALWMPCCEMKGCST